MFDVDFEDGPPMKKLCLNKNDNPYEVADRFLIAEDLPLAYKDQVWDALLWTCMPVRTFYVVQFVMNNTQKGESLRFNADPLTGSSAYTPGSSTLPPTNGLGAFGKMSLMERL